MTRLLKTTVVGSYPVPEWLKSAPSPQALEDAMRLVLDVQERAGIDVIGDGELGRWDLTRRQPAGMVERFVRPMQGVQVESSETVATRIESLADRLGLDRIEYVHPDCGLQVLPRAVADAKLRALVSGRDLFLGKRKVG